MVDRAFGACKTRDFEYTQRNRSIVARGDVSQPDAAVRVSKRTFDAGDVERSRAHTAAVKCGTTLSTDSNASVGSSGGEDEWIWYQIDDIGVNTHITLG